MEVRAVDDLPFCFRFLYSSFKYFNVVQSDCFQSAYLADDNMVVAAPTGSGKTIVMELAMLHLFSKHVKKDVFHHIPGKLKVIYIAPTRSLVQERVRDWTERFGNQLKMNVKELTGDIENIRSNEIDSADIICATPEKFDSVTRKHRDHGGMRFFSEISLVLIDEVHLLSESRGSVLEAGVVSRVRVVSALDSMKQWPIARVRFVAVSATIPNAHDLATWLKTPADGLFIYGEEVRPVKLTTVVRGYNDAKNDFLFERRLTEYLHSVITEFSKGRPTLIFCSSRKGSSDTAQYLLNQTNNNSFVRDYHHMERLRQLSKSAINKQLQQCLLGGIGFHHAGMEPTDRSLVETSFFNQDILVLCTTGTLAMGVNLPAHLVILKGTRHYCGIQDKDMEQNGYREYDRGTCLQMIGRAGRPQFDTEGIAVIMTQKQNVRRYENLATGCEDLESQLKECFAEYLNAEIVLGTIKTIALAVDWLKSTFMYIRAKKNPRLYGIACKVQNQERFDQLMKEIFILENLRALENHGMVRRNPHGDQLEALEAGKLMAHYYIRKKTMIKICEAPLHASIPDLIHIISNAEELENIRLRRGEKKMLNDINCRRTNTTIKYQVLDGTTSSKVKQRISASDEKVFVLINDALSDNPSELDASLRQESLQILKISESITQCMTRYYGYKESLASTANAKILAKCVRGRLWEDGAAQTKQLPNIGKLLSDRLRKGGFGKLKQLSMADPRRIEALTMKHYPFGNALLQELHKRMPPTIHLHIQPRGSMFGGKVKVEVVVEREKDNELAQTPFMSCSFIGGTIHDDKLLINEMINLKSLNSPYIVQCFLERTPHGRALEMVVSLIMDKIVGLDITKRLIIPFDVDSNEASYSLVDNQDIEQGATDLNNDNRVIQRLSTVTEGLQQKPETNLNNDMVNSGVNGVERRPKRKLDMASVPSVSSLQDYTPPRSVLRSIDMNQREKGQLHTNVHNHETVKSLQDSTPNKDSISVWSAHARSVIEARKRSYRATSFQGCYQKKQLQTPVQIAQIVDQTQHTPKQNLKARDESKEGLFHEETNRSASDTKTIFSFL